MWKSGIIKTKRANNAVSEIIGVILLLAMAVALFSTVYLFVMHDALDISENSPPSVTVLGTIGGSDIILEHRGGDALSLDTEIMITISGIVYNMTVGDLMDNESKEDGKWSVGEKLSYGPSMDITGRQVGILVIDAKSNSVVMQGTLQEGETSVDPFAITRYATDVISYSAKLWMDYDFKNYSGYLGFAWKPDGGNWTYSSPSLGSGSLYSGTGSYTEVISDLIPGTLYWFKAQLKYGSTTFEGSMMPFITFGWEMALWHFNESTGTIAFDSSGYSNDGTLKPSVLNRPQWSNTTSDPKWTTWVNGSALTFDGIDDYVEVPDDDTLDLTNAISIEAWVNPLEHSEGIIGDIQSIIDTSEFGSLDVYELDLIHVSGGVYAIVCRGTENDGFLITLRIDSSGMIIDSIIDSLEFDTSDGWQPDIIHVSGNIFAIAYTGTGNDGFLVTVEIANDGTITDSVIDSFEFDESNGVGPSIIHVNNSLYAIVYTGSTTGGCLVTLEMANNGTITKSINDAFIFDEISDGYADEFNMIQVSGETYAIVYNAPDEDGRVRTVKIENNGNIAGISVVKFDSSRGIDPDITHVNGNFYAIAYRGFNSTGNLRTIEIADDGTILSAFQGDGTYTDHFRFSARGGEPSIICVNGANYYAIAYRGPPGASDDRGYVNTVEIWSNGTINHAIIDTLQLDASRCYGPNIISINGTNYYAVTYTGYRDDGFVKTVEIADNGTINQTITDAQEFGIFDCYEPDVIHISGDIYAIASRGLDSDGYVRTVKIANNGSIADIVIDTLEFDTDYGGEFSEIASNGTITNSVIDSLEFDTSYGREPTIIHINGNIYAIAYRGPSSDGFVKTVEIANNGTIKNSFVDSLEFDTYQGYYPDIIHVNGSYYAIAYMGPITARLRATIITAGLIMDITLIP
jgi:flagellin-like protein